MPAIATRRQPFKQARQILGWACDAHRYAMRHKIRETFTEPMTTVIVSTIDKYKQRCGMCDDNPLHKFIARY